MKLETIRQTSSLLGRKCGCQACDLLPTIGMSHSRTEVLDYVFPLVVLSNRFLVRAPGYRPNYLVLVLPFDWQMTRKTASESFQMLKQAFKEDALSQSRTFEWFARFKAGRTSVKNDLHTGRPLSIRNPENALKIKELSEDLYILFGRCQTIIKNDLHLKRSPAKFVPHLLMNEQKEHRKETCKRNGRNL
ncbi:hypothetical protein LAZ67_10002144 [Cordylochernes scorpioides]|uniref:Mos1 transposase HTH domain-containing protein n=1 Tax=Cordylochernes scorpioides TaxID=51811 RepID=A0ABY6KWE9_9ARAC|nr:hypothetical protein LAZ67_10002144 [Cordylochernes scorpioides]